MRPTIRVRLFVPAGIAAFTALACGSGCGGMLLKGHEVPTVTRSAAGERPLKPSVLIRVTYEKAGALFHEAEPNPPARHLAALWEVPMTSGYFSSVAYQMGTESFDVETDYTVDFAIVRDETVPQWYSWLGVLTFGAIPVVFDETYSLKTRVYGRDHEPLGKAAGSLARPIALSDPIAKADHARYVCWLPLLPLNVAAPFLPFGIGHGLGLDMSRWDSDKTEVVENMVRSALAEADAKFRFAVGPKGAQKRLGS